MFADAADRTTTTTVSARCSNPLEKASAHIASAYFFFQAEDGIRDKLVTGVQTCALPIYHLKRRPGQKRVVTGRRVGEQGHGVSLPQDEAGHGPFRGLDRKSVV